MLLRPTRVREKPGGFYISAHGYAENAPDFTLPNKGTPKTRPVLYPNLRRDYLRGVCNTPLYGYMKNLAGFWLKPSAGDILGRMQYAPTRIHAKFGGFHISAHGYVKNAPDFTLPNKDTPKTHPVLGLNLRRRIVSGRMQYAPTRVHRKMGGFHTPLSEYAKNAPHFTLPNRDTPKTCPVLYPNRRRGSFRGVCFCAPTRVRAKPGGSHIFPIRIHPKPARF